MQAAGQYGEVQQYLASRVGASHGHMFNLSHEMSLSSSASIAPAAQSQQAHGHGLSLSHSPAHSQASQSQSQSQTVSLTQPLLQQQQQHGQSGFSVSMASATPITTSAGPSTSIAPQQTQALQSAAQQLQADIKQHQQQQLLQTQQTKADDVRAQEATNIQQKSAITADPIQQIKPNEPPTEPRGNAAISVQSVQNRMAIAIPEKTTKEETSGDGDEVDEEGERVAGVNRWPREEALALLKIRSEMDAVFRDSSLKGPLWEEISRKLAEMGYQRSAKKCKEKFENVHKYYKRTKEGKTGRQDGKSYRFFAQLEALYGKAGASDQQHHNLQYHPHYHQHHQQNQLHHMSTSSALMNLNSYKSPNPHAVTNLNAVGSTNIHSHSGGLLPNLSADNPGSAVGFNIAAPSHTIIGNATTSSNISGPLPLASFPAYTPISASAATAAAAAATNAHIARTLERVESMNHEWQNNPSVQNYLDSDESEDDYDNEDEDDDHDDDEDDESTEPAARESKVPAATQNPPKSGGKKRKRKSLKEYMVLFEKIMKQVLDKQEQMQEKFLEALERRDHDRMIREEAWKRQEMARLNREHDVRATERALAASRDASLVAFLQKITGQAVTLPHQSHSTQMNSHYSNSNAIVPADYMQNDSNADRDPYDPSGSKRWPKPEVLALIKLRTSLEQKFHEPGSKAVLWEEISSGMDSQGYSRPAKRCKEKWENINKYFKKAKESNKKRPENAKTCPYFHHLNALYKEGLLLGGGGGGASSISSKHLLIADKSEDVLEQGVNTSKFSGSGEESSHLHDVGASAAAPSPKKMSVSIAAMPTTTQPPIANAATMMRMASPPPQMSTSTMFTLMTSSATSDAKMHVFMASDRGDKKQPLIDLSAACAAPATSQAAAAAFNLDHAISSSRSLPSGPGPAAPITKQSEQQPPQT